MSCLSMLFGGSGATYLYVNGGSQWQLPHLLGPPRMERDRKIIGRCLRLLFPPAGAATCGRMQGRSGIAAVYGHRRGGAVLQESKPTDEAVKDYQLRWAW